ncbi:MAG: hypothetical protein HXY44_15955 [Syntrophaceae bacterium]|nr:hypothetical protein [Syntrophaceae bacterium]
MEQVHLEEVVQEQEEVLGWVELEEEGWAAPDQVRVQRGSASAPNVGQ